MTKQTIARKLYEGVPGITKKDVARKAGVDEGTIRRWVEKHGWKPAPLPPAVEVAVAAEKREQLDYKRTIKRLESQLDDSEALLRMLRETIIRVAPVSLQYEKPRRKAGMTSISAMLNLGDWHVGAKVVRDEVESLNEYNFDIAQARVRYVIQKFIRWVTSQRSAYSIEECVVTVLQDMIDGLIHDETIIYAEFEPPIQAVKAGLLLAEALKELAAHFPVVRVEAITTDNHSRLTRKVMARGRGNWSLGYVVCSIAQIALENVPNVKFNTSTAIKHLFQIQGHRFLMQHGNDVRGWMGIPFYGLERARAREALVRNRRPDLQFDYMLVGHFHTAALLGNLIMNGALCGTTTYDHANGRFSPPSQTAALVHPRHGLFNLLPIKIPSTERI